MLAEVFFESYTQASQACSAEQSERPLSVSSSLLRLVEAIRTYVAQEEGRVYLPMLG